MMIDKPPFSPKSFHLTFLVSTAVIPLPASVAMFLMHKRLAYPLWTITFLAALAFAYPPTCSPIYGRPDPRHCEGILYRFTSGLQRDVVHFFAVAGTPQQYGVSASQFANKVNIPKFWPQASETGTLGPTNRCKIALLPVQNTSDGTLLWDVSRYYPIEQVGYSINHYCVQALEMPGAVGTGGIDPVGDNNDLRLVLYEPGSKFDNDTLDDYRNGQAVAIREGEEGPAGSDTTEENDPNVAGPSRGPQTRQRQGGGGMGLMSSKGGVKAPRTRSLGGGWYMTYDSVTSLDPVQSAAADLESFYNDIINNAGSQLYNGVNTTTDLAFSFGHYSLRFSSPEPINWTWIINFAFDMLDTTSSEFVALFNGEAYSYIYEIAAVAAVLTTN